MRVLFTTNPGIGHVLPMLPVAELLVQAGHTVAFATAQSFHGLIEQRGLTALNAGLDWLEAETAQMFPEFATIPLLDQGLWMLTEVFADQAAHAMVPDLLALCTDWQPDLIVRNDFEFASCIVGERLQIPYATISISFFLPAGVLQPMIGEQLAYLRSSYGLQPYPALDMLYRHGYLSFAPLSFQPRFLPTMQAFRPLLPAADQSLLPAWYQTMAKQPTVYASMSSVYRVADVFPTILEALRDLDINLILTIGRGQDLAQFGPQPANVYIEQFIPQHGLLPRCDLFISHGPFSTVMSALSHGVPLLLLPFSGELLSGAMKTMELGLGRVLRRPEQRDGTFDRWVQPFSVTTVRDTVQELLSNPVYRSNAQTTQQEIYSLPGSQALLAFLLQLVAANPQSRNSYVSSIPTIA